MKKTTYTATKFELGNGFFFEIVPSDRDADCIDFYLHHKDYGIKDFITGVPLKDFPPETWERFVYAYADKHICFYMSEYMDGGCAMDKREPVCDESKLIELWERTLNNCRFFEKEHDMNRLLNEIGVLRGIAYVMDESGLCPHTGEFLHFIEMQGELTK